MRIHPTDTSADKTLDFQSFKVGIVGRVNLLLWNLIGQIIRQDHARVGRLVADESNLRGAAIEFPDGFDGIDRRRSTADDEMLGHF